MNKTSKPLVIKIGGAILEKESALSALLTVIKSLKNQSIVLVHGGGCVVDEMLSQAGFSTEKKKMVYASLLKGKCPSFQAHWLAM